MEAAVSEYYNQNMNLKWYKQQWNKEVVWVQASAFMSISPPPRRYEIFNKKFEMGASV